MVGTSCSSSSSSASFGSFDEDTVAAAKRFPGAATIKFLCSYGGKILPRYPDGKLRYIGGDTRVLAVDRSVPFSELQEKMREMCGWGAVSVRCQLPTEDLDALVSVKSDEDLANIMEEYDRAGREKIRAFLFPPSPIPRSPTHPAAKATAGPSGRPWILSEKPCIHQISDPMRYPGRYDKSGAISSGDIRYPSSSSTTATMENNSRLLCGAVDLFIAGPYVRRGYKKNGNGDGTSDATEEEVGFDSFNGGDVSLL
ncbi:hypothetical protein OPV22_019561 [Ensete ventricosum]|uniref:PB1 domain-containing protein n=1 Tax=Ensete ventricosum TaxID=4639 RepID=A0AAV8Q7X7_ENSVE|nr:hypothetical protein OPV22_019561 [Ensete ventricosum]